MDQVSQARRNGDADADTAIRAESMKLLGNSAYGKHVLKYITYWFKYIIIMVGVCTCLYVLCKIYYYYYY